MIVPDGWLAPALADLLVVQPNRKLVQQGWSPQCLASPAPAHAWGVLKTTAIQAGWFDDTQHKELPDGLAPRPAIEVKVGDLLITCAGPRARCGVPTLVRATRPRLMMSGKMYRFRPEPRLDAKYLELWLLSPEAQRRIDRMKTGISDSGLNLTHSRFLQLPVPHPEPVEQRRIVAILEEHLSDLGGAASSLDLADVRLRALAPAWLGRELSSIDGDLRPIGSVLTEARGGWSRSGRHLVPSSQGVPYLKMNNITSDGSLNLSDLVFVRPQPDSDAKYGIRCGDVLFNSKNSAELVGKTALADNRVERALLNENIMRLRFSSAIDPGFAWAWFQGPVMKAKIAEATRASTNVAAVYQHRLVEMPIMVPSLESQMRIAAEFNSIRASSTMARGSIEASLRRGQSLRRSLLAAAFSGRLTGHGSDSDVISELAEEASA